MIGATTWTIAGRRGTFLGGAILCILAVVAGAVILAILHAVDSTENPSIGGMELLDTGGGLLFFAGVLVAILMGAMAGSYDTAEGTMRYLVMTGVSRRSIYASRTVALALAILLALVPAVILLLVLTVALPYADGEGLRGGDLAGDLWGIALWTVVYGLVSMGVGSLLRSNGAAITIALVINLGLTPLIVLVAAWNETVASFALPVVLATLVGEETEIGIAVAGAALAGWLALFLGVGWVRVARDEY